MLTDKRESVGATLEIVRLSRVDLQNIWANLVVARCRPPDRVELLEGKVLLLGAAGERI